MKFNLLDPTLEGTADKAVKFFKSQRNLRSIKTKQHPFEEDVWAPTFIGVSDEKISVCVEVSDNPFPSTLDAFILDCKNKGYPVQCYVVLPKISNEKEFQARLRKAQINGVGVIEIDKASSHPFCEATTLSLTGLRDETKKFPKALRPKIITAMTTFRNGDPAKGCSDVYDEIESLSRNLGKYANAHGWWKAAVALPVKVDFDKQSWDSLINFYLKNINFATLPAICPLLNRQLLSSIVGIIPHRNQTNHPQSIEERMARDSKLKTRFESAVDLLLELIEAVQPLGIV